MEQQEKCFFRVCYELTSDRRMIVREVMALFEGIIPHEQMMTYLSKWVELEFYDYGISIDDGRFIPHRIPTEYFK